MAKSRQIIALHLAIDTFFTRHLPVGQIAGMEEPMTIHFYCKGATHIRRRASRNEHILVLPVMLTEVSRRELYFDVLDVLFSLFVFFFAFFWSLNRETGQAFCNFALEFRTGVFLWSDLDRNCKLKTAKK